MKKVKKTIFSSLSTLRAAFLKWYQRDPFREGAAIAFYSVFSLPGLMVVVLTIGGSLLGTEAMSGHLHREITKVMGTETADQVNEMILMAYRSKDSAWATIIGIASILIGATGVFVQLQEALNRIWEVEAAPTRSRFMDYLRKRLFSFGLIVSIAFLLLVSLVISSLLSALSSWLQSHWSENVVVLISVLNLFISLFSGAMLFALMFKVLPDAKIKWKPVWPGAIFTVVMFELGKFALSYYFGHANPGSGYGAAGSIILIMLWTSFSSMIVLFGAVLTRTISDKMMGLVAPENIAVRKKEPKVKA